MNRRFGESAIRAVVAAGFIGAGALHFVDPEPFRAIVPAQLPRADVLVAVSGAAEITGGVGLLLERTRRLAGVGLVALLVAVFPANLNMALRPDEIGMGAPTWLLWARLPLQAVLACAVWFVAFRVRATEHPPG